MRKEADVMLLSIIVPVSKMYKKLSNLNSWLSRIEGSRIEVILVHDVQDELTSQDLIAMVEKLQNPKISLKEGVFGNPGAARNFGKLYASGEYIMFIDSDDVLLIDNVIKSIDRYQNSDILIGGYQSVNSENYKVIRNFKPAKNLIQLAQSPGIWRIVFRRALIKSIDFPTLSMGEDQQFLALTNIFQYDIQLIDKNFYMYFLNNPSQLTFQKSKLQDLILIIEQLKILSNESKGKQRTFLNLLIAKNSLTLSKNLRLLRLTGDSNLGEKLVNHLVRACLRVNVKLAFSSLGNK